MPFGKEEGRNSLHMENQTPLGRSGGTSRKKQYIQERI